VLVLVVVVWPSPRGFSWAPGSWGACRSSVFFLRKRPVRSAATASCRSCPRRGQPRPAIQEKPGRSGAVPPARWCAKGRSRWRRVTAISWRGRPRASVKRPSSAARRRPTSSPLPGTTRFARSRPRPRRATIGSALRGTPPSCTRRRDVTSPVTPNRPKRARVRDALPGRAKEERFPTWLGPPRRVALSPCPVFASPGDVCRVRKPRKLTTCSASASPPVHAGSLAQEACAFGSRSRQSGTSTCRARPPPSTPARAAARLVDLSSFWRARKNVKSLPVSLRVSLRRRGCGSGSRDSRSMGLSSGRMESLKA